MKNPVPTFSHVIEQVKETLPSLSYIHLVTPRGWGPIDEKFFEVEEAMQPFEDIWLPRPLLIAGSLTPESAHEWTKKEGVVAVFGRHFISNVTLVSQSRRKLVLTWTLSYSPTCRSECATTSR